MVVMLELGQRQKVVLVILVFVDKDLEVLVQLLVNVFCLSIEKGKRGFYYNKQSKKKGGDSPQLHTKEFVEMNR